jgi:hypothetical protein
VKLKNLEGSYLIAHIGKEVALNTSLIDSIHSFVSINFNHDMSRCLPETEVDWGRSISVLVLNDLSNRENDPSFEKDLSRVIFLSNNQNGRTIALIVNSIRKIVKFSSDKAPLNKFQKTDAIKRIKLDNKEIEIFDTSKVFIT